MFSFTIAASLCLFLYVNKRVELERKKVNASIGFFTPFSILSAKSLRDQGGVKRKKSRQLRRLAECILIFTDDLFFCYSCSEGKQFEALASTTRNSPVVALQWIAEQLVQRVEEPAVESFLDSCRV